MNSLHVADDFDLAIESCIDPFQNIAVAEREHGREAGRQAGYFEGRQLGRSKGWEIGLELGYMNEFATVIMNSVSSVPSTIPLSSESHLPKNESTESNNKTTMLANPSCGEKEENQSDKSNQKVERCFAVAKDIVKMINDFPDPESLLFQGNEEEFEALDRDDDDTEQQAHSLSMMDVSASMQRIRAKFKLLCVLLRTRNHFDLKRVLEMKQDLQPSFDDTMQGARGDTGTIAMKEGMSSVEATNANNSKGKGNSASSRKDNLSPNLGEQTTKESEAVENDW